MKNIALIIILFLVTSCTEQDCKELPEKFTSYEKATEEVLNSTFKIEQKANVGGGSFLESAKYFSCDDSTGYLIIGMNDQEYIFQGVPKDIWQGFKEAESKGEYYNKFIRGRFGLNLKNDVIF